MWVLENNQLEVLLGGIFHFPMKHWWDYFLIFSNFLMVPVNFLCPYSLCPRVRLFLPVSSHREKLIGTSRCSLTESLSAVFSVAKDVFNVIRILAKHHLNHHPTECPWKSIKECPFIWILFQSGSSKPTTLVLFRQLYMDFRINSLPE